MLTFHSFLQGVYHYMKAVSFKITKRIYRFAVTLSTGFTVVAVMTLTSSSFDGSGRSSLTAYAEELPGREELSKEEPGEIEFVTEAKIQAGLTDSREEGRLVVGNMLAKTVYRKQQISFEAKAEIEKLNTETVMQAQEAAKAEEEENREASSVITLTEEDYQVFLRIVQAEAGICDSKGKILVANVIINRVKDQEFPNTVSGVVYQREQFSPVSDGSINRVKVSKETVECVDRALSGEDYSQGALYFMNRKGSKGRSVRWFDRKLSFLFKHENHEFFK